MDIEITKEEALRAYGGNASALARALKIDRSNISMWPRGEFIQEKHALKLAFILKREDFKNKVPPALTKTKRVKPGKVSAAPVATAGSLKRTGEDGSIEQ